MTCFFLVFFIEIVAHHPHIYIHTHARKIFLFESKCQAKVSVVDLGMDFKLFSRIFTQILILLSISGGDRWRWWWWRVGGRTHSGITT